MNPMSLLKQFRRWLGESRRHQILAAGVVLVAAGTLAAVAVVVAVSGDGDRQEKLIVRTVTASPAAEASSRPNRGTPSPRAIPERSPSPQLETVAFSRGGDIWLIKADGTDLANLTNNPARDSAPSWSPDGSRIAFISERDGNEEIYLMNADGSRVTNLTGNPARDGPYFAWSPDGTRIAFTRSVDAPPDNDIFVMSADGSGQTRLTNDGNFKRPVAWSPDGLHIAFTSVRSELEGGQKTLSYEVYAVNPDGSGLTILSRQLYDTEEWGASFAYSPDGSFIAVQGVRQRTSDIYILNAGGSASTNLTNGSPLGKNPTWSPDGDRIAFDSFSGDIYVMRSDGSALTNLTNTVSIDLLPAWSPEGSKIAFLSYGPEFGANLYVMGADGSGQVRLVEGLVAEE